MRPLNCTLPQNVYFGECYWLLVFLQGTCIAYNEF